jgi:hypothetical protein
MVPWCYRSEQSPCQYISLLSHSCQSASHVGEGVYRYALDVDGNGWSSRFHRLLSSGSPVLKFTMFPEWHMARRVGPYLVSKLDGIRYLFAQFLRGALMSMFSSPGPLT